MTLSDDETAEGMQILTDAITQAVEGLRL
jgi:hypothetical protein